MRQDKLGCPWSPSPPSCPAGALPGQSSQVPTALAPIDQEGASLVGWAGASGAGQLEVRQQKGLAKLSLSVGDKGVLAGLQG